MNNQETLKNLPAERFHEEFKKLLLKAEKPSIGLQLAWELGIFEHVFPEFKDLQNTEQSPLWHPEGDVWVHTKMVVDECAKLIREKNFDESTNFALMLGALCHDIGKTSTTEMRDGNLTSQGHSEAGVEPTLTFLERINADNETKEKVVKFVEYHLAPVMLFKDGGKKGAVRRLARKMHPSNIEELLVVCVADQRGRHPKKSPEDFVDWIMEVSVDMNVLTKPPEHVLTGKELIELGFKPGKQMGEVIHALDFLRDECNLTKEQGISLVHDLAGDYDSALIILRAAIGHPWLAPIGDNAK